MIKNDDRNHYRDFPRNGYIESFLFPNGATDVEVQTLDVGVADAEQTVGDSREGRVEAVMDLSVPSTGMGFARAIAGMGFARARGLGGQGLRWAAPRLFVAAYRCHPPLPSSTCSSSRLSAPSSPASTLQLLAGIPAEAYVGAGAVT